MTRTIDADGVIHDAPEGQEFSLAQIVLMIETAGRAKDERDAAAKLYEQIVGTPAKLGPVRAYAVAHPDEELSSGEGGYRVKRTPRSTGRRFDLMTMARDKPAVLIRLAELGLLSVNLALWDKHPRDFAEATDAKGYEMPGGEEMTISVERVR
jgi:hypothetical protein